MIIYQSTENENRSQIGGYFLNTKQKQLVYELVADNCEHRTAEEVYRAAKARMPQIAMGTVYRNLAQLVNEGRIRKLSVPDGPDRYDGCTRPHEHLFCDSCGKVVDIWCGDLTEMIESRTGCRIASYTLDLHGLCPVCSAAEANGKK